MFANQLKMPVGKRLWMIGGCIAAIALAQVCSGASAGPVRMLVVLGLFAAAALWMIRKLPNVQSKVEPALKVVGKTQLGPKNGLALIEADGIRVLVAFGDGFSQVLPLDAVGSKGSES